MQEIDFCFCFWLAVIAVLLSVTICGLWEASSRWRPWTIFLSLARQVSAKMSNVVVKRGHGQYKLWPCHMPQHPAIYIYLLMFRKSRRLCGVYMGLSCLGARFSKSHKKMGCAWSVAAKIIGFPFLTFGNHSESTIYGLRMPQW